MDAIKLIKYALLVCLLCLSIFPGLAQNVRTIVLAEPVQDRLAAGETHIWTFTGSSGAVVSLLAEAQSDELDVMLTLRNAGNVLISNDDYNFPVTQNALLEAITLPRTGEYEVVVSARNNSAGAYTLTMLPGYAHLNFREDFAADSAWQPLSGEIFTERTENGRLGVSMSGIDLTGSAYDPTLPQVQNFFAQVTVKRVEGRNGWGVGFVLRQKDEAHYYLLIINNQGFWRLLLRSADGVKVVRDWTTHPAIVAGNTEFTLGVLCNGSLFEVFYNGHFVGTAVDSALQIEGRIGLAVVTANALNSQTTAYFDTLIVTEPLRVDGRTVLPDRLMLGSSTATAQELQRRNVIPPGGAMALTVETSSAQDIRPGVSRFIIGRGSLYRNFVLSTKVSLRSAVKGVTGCGIIFRSEDDTHYTLAYIDQSGGYGVARRSGEGFEPGLYGEGLSAVSQRALLVVAVEEMIYYYIDGQFAGWLENPPAAGEIGNAVVNFEPIDTQCEFRDTWLWKLE